MRDPQQAEDILQETFLQVYLKINKLSKSEAFESWLYRITVNLCYEAIREKGKKEISYMDEELAIDSSLFMTEINMPEDIALKKELYKLLHDNIFSLRVKHRVVVILHYFNEFSISEIADIMNCSEGTVKSRLFYARKILKEALSEVNNDFISHNGECVL